MRYRNTRQLLEAYIAKYLMRTFNEFLGRGTGQSVMQHIHLGQQADVLHRIASHKRDDGRTAPILDGTARQKLRDTACHLGT